MLQMQDRLAATVTDILPRLHGILTIMKDSPSVLHSSPNIEEFYDLLVPLREVMARKVAIPTLGDCDAGQYTCLHHTGLDVRTVSRNH